jgi:3-hydroxyacyl-CoA dehydrogenase/enoyl-CoA hydratase/3-hydroxybutyryl-CoA epimerase
LTGEKLSAAQALRIGLIDRAFGTRSARVGFEHFVLQLQDGGAKRRRARRWNDRLTWRREREFTFAENRLRATVAPDHRAAHAALEIIARGARSGSAEGYSAERNAARDAAGWRVAPANLTPRERPTFLPIERVGIVGGGTIGSAIAQWAALGGCAVVVRDCNPAAARARITEQFRQAAAKRLIPVGDVASWSERIGCAESWDGFATADLVIEAIDESQSRKRRLLGELESIVRAATVLATTTTMLPVASLSGSLAHPERFIGMHVVHPAAGQRYVELTAGARADAAVLARVKAWLSTHGKIGIQTADRPGRVSGRILLPYLHEALQLAGEGVWIAETDRAMTRFGMSWGPFAALDEAGLDVIRSSLHGMKTAFGQALEPPPLLKQMTKSGWLGRKSGAGIYRYDGDEAKVHAAALPPSGHRRGTLESVNRLVGRLVNAAFSALGEGYGDADTIDAIVISCGWPAFRGGPIQYAQSRGLRRVVRQLERLADQFGTRFVPSEQLQRLAGPVRRIAA